MFLNNYQFRQEKSSEGWKLAFSFLCSLIVISMGCTSQIEITDEETRIKKLNKSIMCPLCHGESIDQSQNELAGYMRGIVRDQVDQGVTDEEIRGYFVDRYGPVVLMEPPSSGIGMVAWVVPPAGLIVATIAVWITLNLMRRRNIRDKGSGEYTGEESLVSELSVEEFNRYAALFEKNVIEKESETETGDEDQ